MTKPETCTREWHLYVWSSEMDDLCSAECEKYIANEIRALDDLRDQVHAVKNDPRR